MTVRPLAAVLAAAVLLAVPVARADTFTVVQEGTAFVPDDLTIAAGDTVRWVWTSGSHTVTSGTGADDRDLGALFDAVIDAKAPTYTRAFPVAGEVPYLCRPHLALGMTGLVRVAVATPDAGAAWGAVKSLYR